MFYAYLLNILYRALHMAGRKKYIYRGHELRIIFLGKSSFSNHGPLVLIRSLVNRGYVVLIHSHILVVLVNRVHTVLLCSLVLVI